MPITKVNLLSKYITTGRVLAHILENVGHSLIEQHLKQLADKPYNINVDHQQKKRQDEERSGSFQPHLFFLTSSYKTSFLPLYLSLLFLKKDEKVEKPGDDIFVSLDKKFSFLEAYPFSISFSYQNR